MEGGRLAWTHLNSFELLGFTGTHVGSHGFTRIRLYSLALGLTCIHLDSLGLAWIRLDLLGFTWTHLDSI